MNSKGIQKFFPKVTGADARARAVLAATLASFAHLGEESERNKNLIEQTHSSLRWKVAPGTWVFIPELGLASVAEMDIVACWWDNTVLYLFDTAAYGTDRGLGQRWVFLRAEPVGAEDEDDMEEAEANIADGADETEGARQEAQDGQARGDKRKRNEDGKGTSQKK
eukprot:gene26978-7067_t